MRSSGGISEGKKVKQKPKRQLCMYTRQQEMCDPRISDKQFTFDQYRWHPTFTRLMWRYPIFSSPLGIILFCLTSPWHNPVWSDIGSIFWFHPNHWYQWSLHQPYCGRWFWLIQRYLFVGGKGLLSCQNSKKFCIRWEMKANVHHWQGDLLRTGILRAGPASAKARAVLFFTGAESNRDVSYIIEAQVCGVHFILIIIRELWHNECVGQPEHLVLLQILAFCISGCSY